MTGVGAFMEFEQEKTLQEKKQHGSILFPFNIYPCTIPLDFPSVALHWHKSMEIIYIKKGRGKAQVDLQTMETEGGDIFILPPGTLHALHGIPGNVMEYENIIFDVDFLGSGTADICAQQYLVPLAAGPAGAAGPPAGRTGGICLGFRLPCRCGVPLRGAGTGV